MYLGSEKFLEKSNDKKKRGTEFDELKWDSWASVIRDWQIRDKQRSREIVSDKMLNNCEASADLCEKDRQHVFSSVQFKKRQFIQKNDLQTVIITIFKGH